jgi:putative peptidoglycan binding protein
VRNRRAASQRLDRGRDDEEGGFLTARLPFLRNIGWGARDAVAFTIGVGGSVAILVNALFLQSGPHPAPLFKAPLAAGEATNTVVAVPRARPAEAGPAKVETPVVKSSVEAPRTASASAPAPAAAHNDAIGDLLAPSRRVIALQRALAQYGYGQIKPTGTVDAETRAAIEKFERERKLPVTGQPSDRVARELTSLTGRPLD